MSSLHTTDGEGATAFYGSVFGWHPETFGPPEAQMTLWRLPGYVGGEGKWATVPPDVVAVMEPTRDAAAAVPAHWNVNLAAGPVWIDLRDRGVSVDERPVERSAVEYRLLYHLLASPPAC